MKNFRAFAIACLLPLGFAAQAQTETVAPKANKLQQLYLSVGTGPAITTDKNSNPLGGTYQANITAAIGPASIFRLNVQHAVFTNSNAPAPVFFGYLSSHQYDTDFHTANKNSAISLSFGRKKEVCNLLQLQGFAGVGMNFIQTFNYEGLEQSSPDYFVCGTPFIQNYAKPGLLLQTEAMFLPSKFAGLTAGAYANLTTKLPTAGVSLSVNLGLLK